MKAGDRIRLSTLRLLSSELHNRRIELGRDLGEDEAIEVLTRALKRRREAEGEYRRAERRDRAEAEAAEAEVIQGYLPEPLEGAALDALVEEAITATGASTGRDMGRVMSYLMPRVKGRAEGGEVSRRVRERLS